ncbi:DUF4365 domain-containing protein [Geodermatophilus sp. DSM 44513]|uniref:tetratricopeptide repeat protein n=1 Tax=Geodermatophilus sp. DSM 44513 TaxID=1528104 RepID=UPI00141350FB|nr:DUF4365 domain-containing protein [Geodermatophilus sp. DSM 44513]WNV76928.1 DUF4365 domain-containing protein [Geodermatophilus sp. DSM 44513]
MSPSRPREHVLEEESRRAFQAALPAKWVLRSTGEDDYGIDREVEIFENGTTTGLTFKVQLKASEHRDPSGPLRRVTVEHVHYWKSLAVPVLIAYYIADSGELFGRWAHTVGREPGWNPDAQTTTIRFAPSDSLTDVSDRLRREVIMHRQLSAGQLPRPLPLRLRVAPSFTVAAQAEIAVRMRAVLAAKGLRNDVEILPAGGGEDVPAVLLEVSVDGETAIRAALPGDFASIRITVPLAAYMHDRGLEMLVADLFVAAACALERIGANAAGAKLLRETVRSAFLVTSPEVAEPVAVMLGEAGLLQDALILVLTLNAWEDPQARDAADRYFNLALREIGWLDEQLQTLLFDSMRRRAEIEKSSANPRRAGRAHYNLAQALNAMRRTEEALDELELALQYDPSYAERDYFYRERGGFRWTVGDFAGAAHDYEVALTKSGDSAELLPLRADALLWAGKYGEALALLRDWTPTGHDLDRLAALDLIVLEELMSVTGLDEQDRRPVDLDEIAAVESDPEALVALLRLRDALHPAIWHALITDLERQLPRIITVALLMLNHAGAWAMATAVASALLDRDEAEPRLLEYLVASAVRLTPDDEYMQAIEELAAGIASDMGPEEASRLRSRVYEQMEALPDRPLPHITRIIIDPDAGDGAAESRS